MVSKIIILCILATISLAECNLIRTVDAWNTDKDEWITVKMCEEGIIEPKGYLSFDKENNGSIWYFWTKEYK